MRKCLITRRIVKLVYSIYRDYVKLQSDKQKACCLFEKMEEGYYKVLRKRYSTGETTDARNIIQLKRSIWFITAHAEMTMVRCRDEIV